MSLSRPPEEVPDEGPDGAGQTPVRHLPSWLRLYPFEVVSWIGLITGVGFLRLKGLRIGWETFDYTIPYGTTPRHPEFNQLVRAP